MKRLVKWLCFLLLLTSIFSNQCNAEFRAIFDEGTGWATRSGAEETIKRVHSAGFNAYMPCIWHGRGSRFNSKVAPSEKGLENNKEDALSFLVEEAHKKKLEIHPWFCVALRQRDFLFDYYDADSTPNKAFDIHRLAFQKFILNLIVDVVKRYDVDGINLDYIRSMGICTCDYCKKEYRKVYGRNLLIDLKASGNLIHLEPHLQNWQDTAIESIVKQVSAECRKIKDNIKISVCGRPRLPNEPLNNQGRQEIKWANSGLVDIIFNIDYKNEPDFSRYASIRNQLENDSIILMLLGNYQKTISEKIVSINAKTLVRNISELRQRWSDGFGVYIYSMLDKEQTDALRMEHMDIQLKIIPQGNSRH